MKIKKKMPLFVKILLGVVGLGFLFIVTSLILLFTGLSRAKAEARKFGIATTQAEYENTIPSPQGTQSLAEKFSTTSLNTDEYASLTFSNLVWVGNDPSKVNEIKWGDVTKLLQSNSAYLAFIDEAAKQKKMTISTVQEQDSMQMGAKMKSAVQMILLKALYEWQSGRRFESLESIRKAAIVSDQMSRSPNNLSLLTSVYCFNLTFGSLRAVMRTGRASEAELKKLREIQIAFMDAPEFSAYLKGEPYSLELMITKNPPPVPLPLFGSKLMEFPVSAAYSRATKYLKETKSLPNVSYLQFQKLKKLDKEFKTGYESSINPLDRMLSAGFFENSKLYAAYLKRMVFADLVEYMISGKKGTDPYCDTDYGRILGTNETTIYSIGPDERDDGGMIIGEKAAPDIGITFQEK